MPPTIEKTIIKLKGEGIPISVYHITSKKLPELLVGPEAPPPALLKANIGDNSIKKGSSFFIEY